MRYEERQGATVRRNRWGIIDPTPQVKALEYLPRDRYGFVDWARALKEGLIKPKDALPENPAPPPPAFDDDVLIKAKLKFMPDVIFPHSTHNQWLGCAPCHPKMFRKKAGASGISMLAIWKGRYCGRCHDRVAFPIRNCFRCHSVKNVDERRKSRRDEMTEFRKAHPPFTNQQDKDKIRKKWRLRWPL
jgi:c(7)-type cytochrome triheme protein